MPKTFPVPQGFATESKPEIALTAVNSSQVSHIGYDPETKTLAVQFARGPGHTYHYADVEPETHAAFIGAESIGTHFGKHIKALPFKKFRAEPAAA